TLAHRPATGCNHGARYCLMISCGASPRCAGVRGRTRAISCRHAACWPQGRSEALHEVFVERAQWRRRAPPCLPLSRRGEFLDAVIVLVCHVDVAGSVDRNAGEILELPIPAAQAPALRDERAWG